MKVTCMCFGKYKGVEMRSSPFIKEDNILEIIPNHTAIEIEHYIVNDNWYQIKGKEAYIVMWLRTNFGLIDYVCNRGQLKSFSKKVVFDKDDLIKGIKNVIITPITVVEDKKQEVPIQYEEEEPKKKNIGRTKKERIPATIRNIVWVTHFEGSKKGMCWLCKVEDISSANFECGHVVSEKNGGKPTIDNLRPICSFCNKSVGTMNMEDFKKKYNIP
uniref:HNH domain-containing protein n=1 Tax=viral metagenome TaxID=1070528 RepID=A0A6C0KQB4_9ZZZZ